MQTPTSPHPKQKSEKKAKSSSPVADSWEDEADSLSEEDSEEKNNNAANNGNNSNRDKITINNKYNNYNDNDSTPISPIAVRDGIREPPSSPQQFSAPWAGLNAAPYLSYGESNTNINTIRPSPAGRIAADRRPEKQTAVAGRLIAGALGIRAPKRTEEQRAYDRAVKEQEIKRRNEEREKAVKAREEEERAKAAIWDD